MATPNCYTTQNLHNLDGQSLPLDHQLHQRLIELIKLSLRLGITAFGGPAAHISMLHDETVTRRKWLSNEQFLDLLGATHLIPGPNSTEMVIHIGYLRGGWAGLVFAGIGFIAPAMIIVTALAWIYVIFSQSPEVQWLLYGIKPVIIVIILQALIQLTRKTVRTFHAFIFFAGVLVFYFLGINEIVLLIAGGMIWFLLQIASKINLRRFLAALTIPFMVIPGIQEKSPGFLQLFLSFLKIGSVLYGSGYVLLAFLRTEFIINNPWLTEQQLIDAVAVGQLTPGPVFTTATFIGYLLAGYPGAAVATIGIFLPSFIFVAISNPIIPRVRNSHTLSIILDGVILSSLALMAGVTLQLAQAAIIDPWTILLAAVASILLFRYKVNTSWLIILGALGGFFISLLAP